MNLPSRVATTIIAIAAICAVAVAIYLGGWWITKDSTRRDARVRQDTYERQTSLIDGALLKIRDAEATTGPQHDAIVADACRTIARINNPPQVLITFSARECS